MHACVEVRVEVRRRGGDPNARPSIFLNRKYHVYVSPLGVPLVMSVGVTVGVTVRGGAGTNTISV